jgi:hypothetical protein
MIKIAGVILAVIVSLFGLKIYSLNSEIKSLKAENIKIVGISKNLEQDNIFLNRRLETFIAADSINKTAILKLQAERSESLAAIERLSKLRTQNTAKLDKVSEQIGTTRQIPNADGPIAPVLKDAIREIQTIRKMQ